MQTVLIIARTAVRVAELIFLLRAVLSWLPIAESFSAVLEQVTEPLIKPVRVLFEKLGINPAIPIDFPFMITFLILIILESLLFI